ncbi:MAG: DUF2203 domain-containing protein [Dehalococcoidia bacterium]|nr:DUF2203 domain-containing protein [Dehalococcoidia bacterium]
MPPRHFTLEEAEQLLPRLTSVLTEMRELKHEHDRFQQKVAELGLKMKSNGHLLDGELRDAREGMERTATMINELVPQIQDMGCELKDIELGLIDFRAERDGREVYLCWRLGEDRISWWHELQTGYSERQPLA